ncbi:hypothetical protein HYV11_02060 [Candidatus Dependentiae bacterium]|nr:hypothetical protein [Candidatus Dependentiae bacterium]
MKNKYLVWLLLISSNSFLFGPPVSASLSREEIAMQKHIGRIRKGKPLDTEKSLTVKKEALKTKKIKKNKVGDQSDSESLNRSQSISSTQFDNLSEALDGSSEKKSKISSLRDQASTSSDEDPYLQAELLRLVLADTLPETGDSGKQNENGEIEEIHHFIKEVMASPIEIKKEEEPEIRSFIDEVVKSKKGFTEEDEKEMKDLLASIDEKEKEMMKSLAFDQKDRVANHEKIAFQRIEQKARDELNQIQDKKMVGRYMENYKQRIEGLSFFDLVNQRNKNIVALQKMGDEKSLKRDVLLKKIALLDEALQRKQKEKIEKMQTNQKERSLSLWERTKRFFSGSERDRDGYLQTIPSKPEKSDSEIGK